ncbi:nucleoside-diphosphate-sugar epimerase [Tenacibaculum adriaticum]|uniref:Nucleoside-diphosphate-sugar epimerase n=1 Tax=Tenacibaculum adriaticum TaxID=413713 RepID=A0A5S5DTK3_9FLAO|nr:NAD-dependent epimerase/dehydratase family protein [Tenacibaculum adriaticum]TYP98336.1 nucleoside-diphosphate-sugar epimerase [Tenacibaculum adriaticum]
MKTIDKTKPILVTGATGYIASWLVKKLLDEGLTVHAAVRNPNNDTKTKPLNKLAANTKGKIKYFKTNLLVKGSYNEAMKGCELIFHTASPFKTKIKDPQKELIDPALLGTINVLGEANKHDSVKRIVLTSSCSAIGHDASARLKSKNQELTEENWEETASLSYQPYAYSKMLAEKEAWEIFKSQNKWDLVVINPCLVMGPALNGVANTSTSISILKMFGDGTLKNGVPNSGTGVVDIRDVAQAHYNAGFIPSASGRYIVAGTNTSFLEMSQILYKKFGDSYKIPTKILPKWLIMIIGPLIDNQISRKWVRNNVNVDWKANNSKSIRELNMKYRPLEETMIDAFQYLIDSKIIGN